MSLSSTTPPTLSGSALGAPSNLDTAATSPASSPSQANTSGITTTPSSTFRFVPHYSFPPFYDLQPNLTTRAFQLATWSTVVLSYTRHHRIFRLTTSDELFHNTRLNRRFAAEDVKVLFSYMAERGRVEWVDDAEGSKWRKDGTSSAGKEEVWVWWRPAEEWAASVAEWVEDTGQKGVVLTFYELLEGEATRGLEWHGLPRDVLRKALAVMVKRGKATVFGEEEGLGVKFF